MKKKKVVYIRKKKNLNESYNLSDLQSISKLTNWLFKELVAKVQNTLKFGSFPSFKIFPIPANYNYCSAWLGCDTEIKFYYKKPQGEANGNIIKASSFLDTNNILHGITINIFYNEDNMLTQETKQYIQHELTHAYRHRIQLIRDNKQTQEIKTNPNVKPIKEVSQRYTNAYDFVVSQFKNRTPDYKSLAYLIYRHIPEELNEHRANFYKEVVTDVQTKGKKKEINEYLTYSLYKTDKNFIKYLKSIFDDNEKLNLPIDKNTNYLYDTFANAFAELFSMQKMTKQIMINKLLSLNEKQLYKLTTIYGMTGNAKELKEHFNAHPTY